MSEETWHGTVGGYRSRGCRCDECTRANARSHKEWRARQREQRELEGNREIKEEPVQYRPKRRRLPDDVH